MELMLTVAAGVVLGGLVLIHRAWLMDKTMLLMSLGISFITRLARWIWAIRLWIFAAVVVFVIAIVVVETAEERNWEQWKSNRQFAPLLRQACANAGLTYFGDSRNSYYCADYTRDGERPDDRPDVTILYIRGDCSLVKFVGDEQIELGYFEACSAAPGRPATYSALISAAICRISSALRSPASAVLGIRYFPISSPPMSTGS